MTAEFAVALPAVLACLALCLGAVQVATQQARLVDAAAQSARMLARGDDPARIAREADAELTVDREGGMVCVKATGANQETALGVLGLRASARACAPDEGHPDG
ncbi:TadE family type IV pilus minor pilin [Leifsonia sp. NPDC102414]|uniref:TadE family type IV pilus minor pilin n=1 Tax=unclassified Leifsonia TaxID=2663824 RepID=UPI000AB91BCA|nr:TadE family type IV pilus minor pilin [Leifsonia sp. Root227]